MNCQTLSNSNMNDSLICGVRKRIFIIFAAIILLQMLFCIYSAIGKQGYFIDEIYSFGLSNSVGHAFLNRDVSIQNSWVSGDYFKDYLTVQNGERFLYASVYNNQVADVHPPLFYFALHTICSFFPDSYSVWYAIALNILLFIISQILLAGISMQLTRGNVMLSAATLVLYGGTMLAIDNVLFIRMYMMLTMFALLTSYLHVQIFNSEVDFKKCIMLFAVTYAGCMTQYYFGIFAFFLSAVFCIYMLFGKKIKELIMYALTMLSSVGLFLLTFPAVFEHIFGGRRVGAQTLDNALQISAIPQKCLSYTVYFATSILTDNWKLALLIAATSAFFALVLLIISLKRKGKRLLTANFGKEFWLLGISVLLTFIVTALLAFDAIPRYMYFIHPLMVLLAVIFFAVLINDTFEKNPCIVRYSSAAILLLSIIVSLNNVVLRRSSMLYEKEHQNMQLLKSYSNCRGLFLAQNNSTAALTQECRAVMQVKEVFCTEPTELKNLKKILTNKQSESLIVWVDTNKYWSSGFDPEQIKSAIIGSGIYTKVKKLYSYELVDCYIFN